MKWSPPRRKIRTKPSGKPEVGNADRVIRVKMREEQGIDAADRDSELEEPHRDTPPGVN